MSPDIHLAIENQRRKISNDLEEKKLIKKIEEIKTLSELKQFREENSQNPLLDKNMNEIVAVRYVEIRDKMFEKIKEKK